MQSANQVRIAVNFGPELLRGVGGGQFPSKIGPLACLDGLSKNSTNLQRKIVQCVIKVVDEKL